MLPTNNTWQHCLATLPLPAKHHLLMLLGHCLCNKHCLVTLLDESTWQHIILTKPDSSPDNLTNQLQQDEKKPEN
jgi:hypothetical protein